MKNVGFSVYNISHEDTTWESPQPSFQRAIDEYEASLKNNSPKFIFQHVSLSVNDFVRVQEIHSLFVTGGSNCRGVPQVCWEQGALVVVEGGQSFGSHWPDSERFH